MLEKKLPTAGTTRVVQVSGGAATNDLCRRLPASVAESELVDFGFQLIQSAVSSKIPIQAGSGGGVDEIAGVQVMGFKLVQSQ